MSGLNLSSELDELMAQLSPEERKMAEKFAADTLAGMGIAADELPPTESDDNILSFPAESIVDDIPPSNDIAPKETGRRRGRPPGGKDAKLLAGVAGLYYLIATGLMFVNQKDAQIIIAGAQDRAAELLAVANHHPEFKKWLVRFTESNDYLSLILGHGLMALAILSNHGMVSEGIAKTLPMIESVMRQAKSL